MKDPVRSGSPDGDPQPLALSSVSTVPSKAYGSDAACLVRPELFGKCVKYFFYFFCPFVGCHHCEGSS